MSWQLSHYTEPIFLADLLIKNITESELNQQLKEFFEKGSLQKYDEEVYFIPKKSKLNLAVGPNADMVARYRFISKGDNVDGFYAGNTFANQIGISVQVPYVIEIVSNNVSDDGEVLIGNRRFVVRKPVVPITKENVHVLQMLELLAKLDTYLDCSYEEAKEKFAEYISVCGITKSDVELFIKEYPPSALEYYYELGLEHVLAWYVFLPQKM